MRVTSRAIAAASLLCLLLFSDSLFAAGKTAANATAWKNGTWHAGAAGIVSRSDIVLERPNSKPQQAMPLGNGRLGLAVWAEDGLTLQLNRADTLPGRLSPGQVTIPTLAKLTAAPDYSGRLDLYNGDFIEHGNGMSVMLYVEPGSDVVVVNVSGADPNMLQTVDLRLWKPRSPKMARQGAVAVLAETWIDSTEAGATGKTFGSLAAVTVRGRNIRLAADGLLQWKLSFLPEADGSFRVVIASPEWHGGDAVSTANRLLEPALNSPASENRQWWNRFWNRAGLMKLYSTDGSAEYLENLRLVDLFLTAAESRGPLPGTQAGVGDLFSSLRDFHKWSPSAYWHFNLRMQVAANLGAGLFDLNEPYFGLYRDNLPAIEQWTGSRMHGRPGACVPETMRFNGQGFENEVGTKTPGLNCDADSPPYYNARTLSTGAEVSLWIWRQYLATGDRKFLSTNYPVMAAAARFLLAYSQMGRDGLRHTFPSNAHENQWDVHDPTTDISAMRALLPAVIEAARIMGADQDLVREAQAALPKIPELPRTDAATLQHPLTATDDGKGMDVVAQSYNQSATIHNTENVGLEPVWPYSLVGDSGSLHDLEVRTYQHRPNKIENDWSFDPIDAARLGLASEVKSNLIQLTEKYQSYPSGLASFIGPEFYIEQIGVVAAALQEALVQDYDGLIRIAPAWPKDWDVDGTVCVQHNSKVHVQMRGGEPLVVVLESGFTGKVSVRNPWPRETVQVVSGEDYKTLTSSVARTVISFAVATGKSYALERSGRPIAKLPFESMEGVAAQQPKFLGKRSLGLTRQQP